MSEGRSSTEKQDIDFHERFTKSKSALSGIKSKRYFSMPRDHKNSKNSISSSRTGIPSYFKDAAELLVSRIEKQLRKYFNIIKSHSYEVRFKPAKEQNNQNREKHSKIVNERYKNSINSDEEDAQLNSRNFKSLGFPKISEIDQQAKKSHKAEIKSRVVTPTEFLSNNDEFGRLKESNDTIFSFGTSSQGRVDFLGDMTHSSHNSKTSSVERKINKEFNIDEIKEAEIENTEKDDSEHEEKIIKIVDSPHYIGDGDAKSQADEYNLDQFLQKSPPLFSQQILDSELNQRAAQSEEKYNQVRELTKDLFNSKAISPDANLYEFKDRQAYREETKIRIKKLKEKIEAVGQDLNRDNSETHNESNKDIFQVTRESTIQKQENRSVIVSQKHSTKRKNLNRDLDFNAVEENKVENSSQNFEGIEAISIIPEVDESNFTTGEKFRHYSPTWGKGKISKRTQNLDKIPFNIEDEQDKSSPEIQMLKNKVFSDCCIQTEIKEDSKEESIQADNNTTFKEQFIQTFNKQYQSSQSSQVNIPLSNTCQKLQANFIPENKTESLQTEEQKNKQESKEIQTVQAVKQKEQEIQTFIKIQEEYLQTDFLGQPKGLQTECIVSECIIQTANEESKMYYSEAEVQCEYLNFADSRTQTDQEFKSEMKNASIQAENKIQMKASSTQHIVDIMNSSTQYDALITESSTQTDEEKQKKTRTGGVQVCIGNRLHLRQIKLARILMLNITNHNINTENDKAMLIKTFLEWKLSRVPEPTKSPISPRPLFPLLESIYNKRNEYYIKQFFEKLKDNTIKCMLYDQEKAAERHEKYIELEEAVKALMHQNEVLQNKQLYFEDFIQKKEHDLKQKKTELNNANK